VGQEGAAPGGAIAIIHFGKCINPAIAAQQLMAGSIISGPDFSRTDMPIRTLLLSKIMDQFS